MKSEAEIRKAQETIKNSLTRETDSQGIAMLQGQYASLEWMLSESEEGVKKENG